jgi:hypothetical protein
MNGFTEPRASGASEQPGPGDQILTWGASQAMLPLVGLIAADIVANHQRQTQLQPELNRLERRRRSLNWPERSRRYSIQDELVVLGQELQGHLAELTGLGVVLLDLDAGLIGFPTVVNDRKAYFSWQPGEDGVKFWSFADETDRHPVPEHWTKPVRENNWSRYRPKR